MRPRERVGCGLLLAVILLCIAGAVLPGYFQSQRAVRRVMAISDLKLLTLAAQLYALDSDGRMPEGRNWCDLLRTQLGTNSTDPLTREGLDKLFARSGCGFAINRECAGQPLDSLPEDAVVFLPVNARGTNLVADLNDPDALWWDGRSEMRLVRLGGGERWIRRQAPADQAAPSE